VVGVDPSEHAAAAVDWAADEAALRGWPLRIVHARGAGAFRPQESRAGHPRQEVDEAARQLVRTVESRARARQGAVAVEAVQVEDEPLAGLVDAVGPDDLLVVGSRGHGRFSSMLIGSVSQGVAAHAPCPVVVVPDRGAGLATAPVVLGAGPGEHPAAVEFAFAEAAWRTAPLFAVRAWSLLSAYPGLAEASPKERFEHEREQNRGLAALLEPARRARPDVTVQTQVVEGHPDAPLVDASNNASLVVLGAEREHGRFAPPLGRVVHRVLHHALCPVAVISHD
jgi:nucleotide-binding universal stress UspA family protein